MAKEREEQLTIVNSGELGNLLQGYRETIAYSTLQMAEALCLSEEVILKLEDENFDALPEPPYVRGYLRNYAKLAESDPEVLITTYEALRGADPSELDYHFKGSSKRSHNLKKGISPVFGQLFFLALLIAILGAISMIPAVNNWITETWDSFSDQTASHEIATTDNPILTGSMPVPIPLPSANNETKANSDAEISEEKTVENTTDAEQKEAEEKPSKTTQTAEEATTTDSEPQQEESATNNDTIKIKLVFNKEVWLRIRDENKKTLFEATNQAGKEKELELKKPITFRVGNAQGLSLFVDGNAVDISSYIKGSVANFTLE